MFKKIGVGLAAVAGVLVSLPVFAAADAELVNMATSTATTLKENAMGAFTSALPILLIIAAALIVLRVVMSLTRKFTGR